MVGAGSAPVIELAALGVRRISSGPQLAMSAYGEVRAWAHAMVQGRFDSLPAGASPADLHADRASRNDQQGRLMASVLNR